MSAYPAYVLTRGGETFTVAPEGLRLVDADGEVLVNIVKPVDELVAADTLVGLVTAGWTFVTGQEGS